jgi:hypothetical protein
MVDTILAGLPVREPGRMPVLAVVTLLTVFTTAGILCARRLGVVLTSLATAATLYLSLSFPVFWWAGQMLPVSLPLLLALFGLSLALVVRRMLPPAPEVSS